MLLVLFISIIIMVNVFYRSARKNQEVSSYVLPHLGIQDLTKELKQHLTFLVRHLDQTLDKEYVQYVKERVMREQKINEREWENRWFEWKRMLLVTLICKDLPLYSREVDEIWHEILAEPQQYEDFSQKLTGKTFHQVPELPTGELDRNQRAWFDLIYHLLFQPTAFSQQTWGEFFRYPLSKTITHDFSMRKTEELVHKYFSTECFTHVPILEKLVKALISYIQQQLKMFEQLNNDQLTVIASKKRADQEQLLHFLYRSVYQYETYEKWKASL